MAEKRARVPPPAKTPKTAAGRIVQVHANQLERHIRREGVQGLAKLFKSARGDLLERLRRLGPPGERASQVVLRALISQVDSSMATLGADLSKHVTKTARTSAEFGAEQVAREYKLLEKRFRGTTPILDLERASIQRGLVEGVESSLLRRHSIAAGTWSQSAVLQMEQSLSVATLSGKPLYESVTQLADAMDTEHWKAERIVRTENAYAHGAVRQAATSNIDESLPKEQKLMKRLIETFDDRTGDDSFLLHGQTVAVDSPFVTMRKSKGGWKRHEFMFPPSRPNDRSVMIPWDPTWDETEAERPLTRAELAAAPTTRWRDQIGVEVPPGHRPGLPSGGE